MLKGNTNKVMNFIILNHGCKILGVFLLITTILSITITWQIGKIHHKNEFGVSEVDKQSDIMTMKNRLTVSRTPLVNNRMNDNNHPSRYMLCFVFPGFFNYGGVETWFWNLYPSFSQGEFTVHSVKVLDSWAPEIPFMMEGMGIFFNPSMLQMQIECDIIIMTGSHPVKRLIDSEKQLLVIHGGSNCDWTKNYAKFYRHYDFSVGVSHDSLNLIDRLDRNQSVFIPTPVLDKLEDCEARKPCENTVLWLGRISSEKDPELFCSMMDKMPLNHCGWVVGPYYHESYTPRCSDRTIIAGPTKKPLCFMKAADVVVNTSPQEGGPIVAIEAWMLKKPFYMFDTGLMKVFGHDDMKFKSRDPTDMASLLEKQNDHKVDAMFEVYQKIFSPKIVYDKWNKVLISQLKDTYVRPIHIDIAQGGYVQNHGRSRTLFCYKYCIFGNTLRYWIHQGMSSIIFYYIMESDYNTSSIKIKVGSRETWLEQFETIKDKIMMARLNITYKEDLEWRIIMSETIITLFAIEIL